MSTLRTRAIVPRLAHALPVLWLALALAVGPSCGTTYCYRGTLVAPDTTGAEQEFVLYWNKTERLLWFDETEGTVRLKPEHGTAIGFNEDEEGLIFRNDSTFEGALGREVPVNGECGRVLTARRVVELPEGEILVVLWCRCLSEDEFAITSPMLQPREQPYVFVVQRTEVAAGTDCSESPVGLRPPQP